MGIHISILKNIQQMDITYIYMRNIFQWIFHPIRIEKGKNQHNIKNEKWLQTYHVKEKALFFSKNDSGAKVQILDGVQAV